MSLDGPQVYRNTGSGSKVRSLRRVPSCGAHTTFAPFLKRQRRCRESPPSLPFRGAMLQANARPEHEYRMDYRVILTAFASDAIPLAMTYREEAPVSAFFGITNLTDDAIFGATELLVLS